MQKLFIGDVQGCADELDELLERAELSFDGAFEAWFVGDLVNRGPHSLRVLRRVRSLAEAGRARCVIGNHEIGLLMTAVGLRTPSPLDTYAEVLEAADAADWIDWIRRLPLVESGEVAGERFAMLHAAAHPDWDLDELCARARAVERRLADGTPEDLREFLATSRADDPDRDALDLITRCRSVDARGAWSDAPPAALADAWHQRWKERRHGYSIVYGHWSLQGLHVELRLRGLDTGCVHHGRDEDGFLTAWVPDSTRGFVDADDRLWQVRGQRRYIVD